MAAAAWCTPISSSAASPVLVEIDRRGLVTAAIGFQVPAEVIALPFPVATRLRAQQRLAGGAPHLPGWRGRVVARR